jgi:transposase InsO family protein
MTSFWVTIVSFSHHHTLCVAFNYDSFFVKCLLRTLCDVSDTGYHDCLSCVDEDDAGVMLPFYLKFSFLLMGVFFVRRADVRLGVACEYDTEALDAACKCSIGNLNNEPDCSTPVLISIPLEDLGSRLQLTEGLPVSIVYATEEDDPRSFFVRGVEGGQDTEEHSKTDGSLSWLLCVDLHLCSRKVLYLQQADNGIDSDATTQEATEEVYRPAGPPVVQAKASPFKPAAQAASTGSDPSVSSSQIDPEPSVTGSKADGVPVTSSDDKYEGMSSLLSSASESDADAADSPVMFADLYETDLQNQVYNYLKHGVMPLKYRVFSNMTTKEKRAQRSRGKAFRQNCRRRYVLMRNNSGYTDLVRKSNTKEDKGRKDNRSKNVNVRVRKKLYPLRVVLREKDIMPTIRKDHAAHHDGHNKGEERLTRGYHIHNLREKYLSVCGENCAICSKFASIPKKPHRRICTDHFGELVMFDLTEFPIPDEEGRQWLLVVEDHFTKFTWVQAFQTKESKPIAEYLVRLFLDVSCVPERWHADNGGEFNSGYFDEARRILASNSDSADILAFSHSLPRNPQCNGMVERRNKTLKLTSLKRMAEAGYKRENDDTWDWFPVVQGITRVANRAPVKMYGIASTPYLLLHGRKPEAPDHAALEPHELCNLRQSAAEKQLDAAKGAAVKADEWAFDFSVGDAVRVSAPNDKRKYTDKSGSGRAGWPAAGVIERITSQGYYKILWTEGALNGDRDGTVSKKAYPGSRLKPDKTWQDHASQNEPDSEEPPLHTVDPTTREADVDLSPSQPAFTPKRCRPQSKSKRKQTLSMSQDFPMTPPLEKKQRTEQTQSASGKHKHRRRPQPSLPVDRRGQFVSIPLQWFNKTAWTRRFRTGTFLVAVVVFSEPNSDQHHLLILGDREEGGFMAKEEVVLNWKKTWLEHQKPKIPHYTIGCRAPPLCTYICV